MKVREIYNYAGTLYAINLATSAITFLVMILMSRAISKEALGTYGLFQAYFLVGVFATGLGMSQGIVKYVAGGEVDVRQIHSLMAIVLAVLAAALISAGIVLIRQGHEIAGLAMIGVPAYHMLDFSLSYARGHLWQRTESTILLFSSLLTSALIVTLLQWFDDHRGPIYAQIVSAYVMAAVLLCIFFLWPRYRAHRFERIRGAWVKSFALVAFPVFIASSLFSLGEAVDRFIIERFLGLEVLAEYFIAVSFFAIVDKPVAMLSRVLLSHFSVKEATSAEPAKHLKSLHALVKFNVVAFPVFGLAVVSILPLVLSQFFNKDYSNAFDILAIISVIIVIKAFEVINSMLTIARNNARTNMYSQFVALFVYVPVAVVMVKLFGIYGVALSVALRWAVYAFFQFGHMKSRDVVTVPPSLLVRTLAAYAAAMAFFFSAPWAMVPVYLLAGAGLRLWNIKELVQVIPLLRPARVAEK